MFHVKMFDGMLEILVRFRAVSRSACDNISFIAACMAATIRTEPGEKKYSTTTADAAQRGWHRFTFCKQNRNNHTPAHCVPMFPMAILFSTSLFIWTFRIFSRHKYSLHSDIAHRHCPKMCSWWMYLLVWTVNLTHSRRASGERAKITLKLIVVLMARWSDINICGNDRVEFWVLLP